MGREDCYREQLARLAESYPGKEVLSIQEVCKMFGCNRRKLLADRSFPAKQICGKGKYFVPLPMLAKWMVK